MLKKLTSTALMLILSSAYTLANASPYLGLGLGYNENSFKLTSSGQTTNFNAHGFNEGVFVGYNAAINQTFNLGAELFANWNGAKTQTKTIDGAGTTVQLQTQYSYGASILPGIWLNHDVLAYARLGVVATRFEVNQNPIPNFDVFGEQTAVGGQAGLGLQANVSKHVAVRGEYVYTGYRSFSEYGNRISPHTSQVNLGLVYNFG